MNAFKPNNSGYKKDQDPDNRFFKNKNQIPEKKEFTVKENEFPDLTVHKAVTSTLNPSISFLDMMKESMNVEDTILEEPLDPGWVSIKRNKDTNKIEWKSGSKTESMKRIEYKESLNDNLNYSMHKAINTINDNNIWYEDVYDEIYGEGAYSILYRYDIQYSESDDEDKMSNDE